MPLGTWQPTTFKRFYKAHRTSLGTAQIMTDVGRAYLKALGNPQGPHVLALLISHKLLWSDRWINALGLSCRSPAFTRKLVTCLQAVTRSTPG